VRYYIYQIVNLMPQLFAVQIVAWLFGSNQALTFTKVFYTVTVLSVVIDWGASSIGSRHLNGKSNSSDKCTYINTYERLRIIIFIVILLFYGLLASFNLIERSFEFDLGVFFGLCSSLIFPNWLHLTKDFERGFLFRVGHTNVHLLK